MKRNGYIEQSGVHALGKTDAKKIFWPVEGVVVGVHYPQDDSNLNKKEMEYDVQVTSMNNLGTLKNVPRSYTEGGVDDGSEGVLTAASTTTNKTQFVPDSKSGQTVTPRFQTNGDVVVVTFINGNVFNPLIIAVRQHKDRRRKVMSKPSANKAGLPQRLHTFRGNDVMMDTDGNVEVTIGKSVKSSGDEDSDAKKLTLNIGDFKVTIDNSSSPTKVTFGVPNGPSVQFTKDDFQVGASGLEPMVMGDALTTWLTAFRAAFNAHTHTVPAGSLVAGTTAVTGTTSATAPAAFGDSLDVKSIYAKVSKNKP